MMWSVPITFLTGDKMAETNAVETDITGDPGTNFWVAKETAEPGTVTVKEVVKIEETVLVNGQTLSYTNPLPQDLYNQRETSPAVRGLLAFDRLSIIKGACRKQFGPGGTLTETEPGVFTYTLPADKA